MDARFEVEGANRETGEDIHIVIDARDEVDAEAIANRLGIAVSRVSIYRSKPSPYEPRPKPPFIKIDPSTTKQCPKCKSWIDKSALKCTRCKAEQPVPWWSYAIAAVIVAIPLLWCSGVFTPGMPSSSRQSLVERQFSAWDGSHPQLTRVIKNAMNDPSTYQHISTVYRDEGDCLWVRTTFRGRNSFGGMTTNSVSARVDLDGNVIEILDQSP